MVLKPGTRAPTFKLPDQNGRLRSLPELLEGHQFTVLYFYPRDETPGCIVEACGFRDAADELRRIGAEVVGVSVDTPLSHQKFAAKRNLNFTLLSDTKGEVSRRYESFREGRGTAARNTYVINKDGIIVGVFESVKPDKHPAEIREFLERLGA